MREIIEKLKLKVHEAEKEGDPILAAHIAMRIIEIRRGLSA